MLFPKLDAKGQIKDGLRWVAKDLIETLKRDLENYCLYEGETPHSFRHGGTVDSLKNGKGLEKTMYLAYMKGKSTAAIYSRWLEVLLPKGFDWKKGGVQTDQPLDPENLSKEMQAWKAFLSYPSCISAKVLKIDHI